MTLSACHRTTYRYPVPSVHSHNEVRLMPVTDASQRCMSFELLVSPGAAVQSYEEVGGTVHHFGIVGPHALLDIVATAVVETRAINPFEGLNLLHDDWAEYKESAFREAFAEYLVESPYVELGGEFLELAQGDRRASSGSVVNFLLQLGRSIYENFEYDQDVTHVHSSVSEVLKLRAGVCQDFAHLMIACCRSIGIPARYVSGYLYSEEGSGVRGEQAMHAWVECPLPDGRWLALDPTNNLLANELYVKVHTGRDYSDVTPTRGVYVGAPASTMEVTVGVGRVGAKV